MATKSRKAAATPFTLAGLDEAANRRLVEMLQERLVALTDLSLVLKHIHWNVVGPHFIGVHEMLDPQVDAARLMVDATAERIAAMGGSPNGNAGALVATRTWDDYDIMRASTQEHLAALDVVYTGLLADHRSAMEEAGDLDPVTEDLLIAQVGELEQFHWFVRAHLETMDGSLITEGETTERGAASRARGNGTSRSTTSRSTSRATTRAKK